MAELKLPKKYRKNNPNILEQLKEDFKEDKPFNYFFTGNVGCGKTYLAKIIIYSTGGSGSWEILECRNVYKDYLRLMESNYTDKHEALQRLDDKVKKKMVLIDDLGDERPSTPGSHDYVGSLLVERCETIKRTGTCNTLITTNLKQKEIMEMYGSRVVDRLEENFIMMKFEDHSFRRDKRQIIKG
tara:strand:+ start:1019 stop:1573 length:555 start_codon:yes stop_codon:yes gene_type:complete